MHTQIVTLCEHASSCDTSFRAHQSAPKRYIVIVIISLGGSFGSVEPASTAARSTCAFDGLSRQLVLKLHGIQARFNMRLTAR